MFLHDSCPRALNSLSHHSQDDPSCTHPDPSVLASLVSREGKKRRPLGLLPGLSLIAQANKTGAINELMHRDAGVGHREQVGGECQRADNKSSHTNICVNRLDVGQMLRR